MFVPQLEYFIKLVTGDDFSLLILIIKKDLKLNIAKHKQDRFFSMKWYKNQVIGMSGHTGQTEKKELAVEAGFLFSPRRMAFTCRVFILYVY